MQEVLDTIKNILSSFVSDKHPIFTPRRKRRLSGLSDVDNFQSKMRRFDDFSTLPRCSSPIDTPSSSKSIFKKPYYPANKPFMRPTEFIDISDDDDVEFVSKNHNYSNNKKPDQASSHSSSEEFFDAQAKQNSFWEKSNIFNRARSKEREAHKVIERAKSLIARNSALKFQSKPSTSLDESIRLDEYAKYKKMLDTHRSSNDNVFLFNGNSKKSSNEKSTVKSGKSFRDLYSNTLKSFSAEPKAVVDLTSSDNENGFGKNASIPGSARTISIDSDSDSDVKIVSQKVVSPVNSLKKRLDIEPIASNNWVTNWDDKYKQTVEDRRKQIQEYEYRRDKFRDVNKQNVQFRFEETLKNCLRIQDIIISDEEPEEKLKLPELTEDHERIINNVLRHGPPQQVFIDKFNLRITRADLMTLKGLNWLNDEVINFYTSLITERGNGKNPKMPKVHSMNTFFYPKLISQGYSSLRRWTKKVDIFAQDIVVIPVHLGVHWCLSIIDFRDKMIKYFDSMGSPNQKCLHALLEYLKSEHLDKKKSEFDSSAWKLCSMRDIPQQMNGSDCGVFACMYAEFITRNAKILFTQEHMPYFRKKMVFEIVTGELLIK